jgi:hypothetical protein
MKCYIIIQAITIIKKVNGKVEEDLRSFITQEHLNLLKDHIINERRIFDELLNRLSNECNILKLIHVKTQVGTLLKSEKV